MMLPRNNWIMSEMVNFAITLASFKGIKVAAEFMRRHNVPIDVAKRVLTTEERR